MARDGAVFGVDEFDVGRAPIGRQTGGARRARERAWCWVVTSALLVSVGAVSAPAHTSTDGLNLVASLASAPQLAWEAPLTTPRPSARLEAEVIDGVVAVTNDSGASGYDLDSGAVLWEIELDRPRCTYQVEIVCVSGRLSAATVITVAPRTGAMETTSLPSAAWALRIEDDLVALLYSEDNQRVVRVDDEGSMLWSTDVPFQPGIGGAASGYPFARVDDRLYVGTAGPAILDVDTGATLARPLLLRYDRSGIYGLGFNETWWHLWSGEQVILPEGSARLGVDDDLDDVTDVLVSAATGITQLREGKDEPFWSGIGGEDPLARLDGVLVTSDDQHAVTHGVDLTTGAVLWTTELMSCPCLGAGDVLLLSSSQTVPAGLTAIDVHTGLPAWQLAFPPATSLVQLVDGGALAIAADQLVLYRW